MENFCRINFHYSSALCSIFKTLLLFHCNESMRKEVGLIKIHLRIDQKQVANTERSLHHNISTGAREIYQRTTHRQIRIYLRNRYAAPGIDQKYPYTNILVCSHLDNIYLATIWTSGSRSNLCFSHLPRQYKPKQAGVTKQQTYFANSSFNNFLTVSSEGIDMFCILFTVGRLHEFRNAGPTSMGKQEYKHVGKSKRNLGPGLNRRLQSV